MNDLTVIEQKGQRVLTTQQLSEAYGTESSKIHQNFNNNKDRYKEGKHYFLLQGDEIKTLRGNLENFEVAQNVNKLYLWTEKGTLLHAKSLNTDEAWDVYEKLVDDYFRIAAMIPVVDKHKLPSRNKQILLLTGQVEQYKEFTEAHSDQIKLGFPDHKPEYLTEKEACKIFKRSSGFFRSELVGNGYLELQWGVLRITENGKKSGEEIFISPRRIQPFVFRFKREVFEEITEKWNRRFANEN